VKLLRICHLYFDCFRAPLILLVLSERFVTVFVVSSSLALPFFLLSFFGVCFEVGTGKGSFFLTRN
jgi:hypothetical protein